MVEYGKLNFSSSFNPTSAFPLDARCYFDSYEKANAAAKSAVEVGSSESVYYVGQILVVVENQIADLYVIQPDKTLKKIGSGQGSSYNIGDGLKFDGETNTLSVDTTNNAEEDNTKPITSAGVYTQIGNINVLLSKI